MSQASQPGQDSRGTEVVTWNQGSKKQAGGNFLEPEGFFFCSSHCPAPSLPFPSQGGEGSGSRRLRPENMGAVNASPAQWLGRSSLAAWLFGAQLPSPRLLQAFVQIIVEELVFLG